jgi:hypothetical protein
MSVKLANCDTVRLSVGMRGVRSLVSTVWTSLHFFLCVRITLHFSGFPLLQGPWRRRLGWVVGFTAWISFKGRLRHLLVGVCESSGLRSNRNCIAMEYMDFSGKVYDSHSLTGVFRIKFAILSLLVDSLHCIWVSLVYRNHYMRPRSTQYPLG